MISEQITRDYLEQENNSSDKLLKFKVALLLASVTSLILLAM